jgi:signal peptidase I
VTGRVAHGRPFIYDNSTDCRVLTSVGYIPLENVVGRVGMIFFSLNAGGSGTQSVIRYWRHAGAIA